ncbi:hypothetical protein HPB48_022148 [Haemaphysalis longicornis]|uniref:RING-type domain-containing protein n=1 Tax=Haemaphysalis longicornis TaxID=44386 RepID=A0A9J6GXR6_HAELO|nr:hypothetical protein HPB48_022148 [Haemaphysalis longicornis]
MAQLLLRCLQEQTLKAVYNKFKAEVDRLQEFWETMDDLDANCWVLDPVNARHSDCYRRLALGMELPSRNCADPPEDVDCTCGICYSYFLEGHIPDTLCQNTHCSKPFHQACLAEWMRSLPSIRQNFDMFFGECPYCSEGVHWSENRTSS